MFTAVLLSADVLWWEDTVAPLSDSQLTGVEAHLVSPAALDLYLLG